MKPLSVLSLESRDFTGNILEGAEITVRRGHTEGGDLVEVFEDPFGNTPKSNPFTASDGSFSVYTYPGPVRVEGTSSAGAGVVLVDLQPNDVVSVEQFGVRVNDPSAAVENVSRINEAEEWAAHNGVELTYPSGVIYCEGRVIWRDRVYRRGMGVQPNIRPAPVSMGASTPPEQFRNEVGCELRFIGSGVKDLTFPWVTNGRHSGFGRENPRRAYNNSFDERLDLRDFSNQDANGATPATLRQLSAAVVIQTNTLNRIYCEGITIRTACDGVSEDGGTGLEGYEATDRLPEWADYDIGLLVDSPWQGEFYRLSVLGYWNEAGVFWSASRNAPEFEDAQEAFRGYAEGNIWRHCIFQSGWVYRTADTWPILDKDEGANTITVPWTPSHQFQSSGTFRAGRSFVSFDTYNYDGVTFDDTGPEPVLILQITSSVADIEVGNNGFHLFFSGGAGPALSGAYNCEFYDLSPTSLLHESAYGRSYRAGCEISGGVSRALRFQDCYFHSHGFMPIAVGYANDLQLSDCYIEPRRFRLTHGGALQDRGGLFIYGPKESKRQLLGTRWNGSVYARGYFQWPGLNMAPLQRVSETGWFGGIEGDWFNPRSYSPPIEQVSRTSRVTGLEGLRGSDVRLVARREDATYYPGVVVKGDTGSVLLGRRVTGGDEEEGGPAEAERTQLILRLGGDAVLRAGLDMTDEFSPELKNIFNDQNGGLAEQDNPTADGLRFIASLSQLRLRSTGQPALQVHRSDNGTMVDLRRDGTTVGRLLGFEERSQFEYRDGVFLTGFDSSSPEGLLSANPGSICTVSSGSSAGLWLKVSGTGNAGWVKFLSGDGVYGWGTQSTTTFDGSMNDLMTDFPRGVYITGTSTTDGPDAGTNVFEVINLPRLSGARGSQMVFASPGAGSDRVFTRGYGSGGFTPWAEVFTTARAIPPGPFADDAAAASGGVPVGSIYRVTDGTIAWRQA